MGFFSRYCADIGFVRYELRAKACMMVNRYRNQEGYMCLRSQHAQMRDTHPPVKRRQTASIVVTPSQQC